MTLFQEYMKAYNLNIFDPRVIILPPAQPSHRFLLLLFFFDATVELNIGLPKFPNQTRIFVQYWTCY